MLLVNARDDLSPTRFNAARFNAAQFSHQATGTTLKLWFARREVMALLSLLTLPSFIAKLASEIVSSPLDVGMFADFWPDEGEGENGLGLECPSIAFISSLDKCDAFRAAQQKLQASCPDMSFLSWPSLYLDHPLPNVVTTPDWLAELHGKAQWNALLTELCRMLGPRNHVPGGLLLLGFSHIQCQYMLLLHYLSTQVMAPVGCTQFWPILVFFSSR